MFTKTCKYRANCMYLKRSSCWYNHEQVPKQNNGTFDFCTIDSANVDHFNGLSMTDRNEKESLTNQNKVFNENIRDDRDIEIEKRDKNNEVTEEKSAESSTPSNEEAINTSDNTVVRKECNDNIPESAKVILDQEDGMSTMSTNMSIITDMVKTFLQQQSSKKVEMQEKMEIACRDSDNSIRAEEKKSLDGQRKIEKLSVESKPTSKAKNDENKFIGNGIQVLSPSSENFALYQSIFNIQYQMNFNFGRLALDINLLMESVKNNKHMGPEKWRRTKDA